MSENKIEKLQVKNPNKLEGYSVEITEVEDNKKTKFAGWNRRTIISKNFNPEEIYVIAKGKKINMYDRVQEAREDTEIYAVLEKYNGDLRMTTDKMTQYAQTIEEDLSEITDLRSMFDAQKAAKLSWESLPEKIREQFGHNIENFVTNGRAWAKTFIDEKIRLEKENDRINKLSAMRENAELAKELELENKIKEVKNNG